MIEGMRNKQQLFNGLDTGESKNPEDGASIPAMPPPLQGTCTICMASLSSTHALIPRGHFCLRGDCSVKTMDRGCPICQQCVCASVKMFFSQWSKKRELQDASTGHQEEKLCEDWLLTTANTVFWCGGTRQMFRMAAFKKSVRTSSQQEKTISRTDH